MAIDEAKRREEFTKMQEEVNAHHEGDWASFIRATSNKIKAIKRMFEFVFDSDRDKLQAWGEDKGFSEHDWDVVLGPRDGGLITSENTAKKELDGAIKQMTMAMSAQVEDYQGFGDGKDGVAPSPSTPEEKEFAEMEKQVREHFGGAWPDFFGALENAPEVLAHVRRLKFPNDSHDFQRWCKDKQVPNDLVDAVMEGGDPGAKPAGPEGGIARGNIDLGS